MKRPLVAVLMAVARGAGAAPFTVTGYCTETHSISTDRPAGQVFFVSATDRQLKIQ